MEQSVNKTKEEILKALEGCQTHGSRACASCPYSEFLGEKQNCIGRLHHDVVSLVNRMDAKDPKIEFVAYNGKWPNLCSGELTLRVNGEVRLMPEFLLISGGKCGFKDKEFSESYVEKGEWRIVDSKLPEDLKPYRKEIVRIINENVPHGCCGGCL